MSVFKRGLKISRGATVDESDSESDSEEEEIQHQRATKKQTKRQHGDEEVDVSDDDEEGEDEGGDDDDDDDEESEGEVDLGWKYEPDSAVDEEGEKGDGEVSFPLSCSVCQGKTLFTMTQVEEHMKSKKHLKNERQHALAQRKEKRTPEQVAKLKARNERKKLRKLERKKADKGNRAHVWGEHKKPEKRKDAPSSASEQASKKKAKATPKAEENGDKVFKKVSKGEGKSPGTGRIEQKEKRGKIVPKAKKKVEGLDVE